MARKAYLISVGVVAASVMAHAQPVDPIGDLLTPQAQSQPSSPPIHQTVRRPLSERDLATFRGALESARRGDVTSARSAIASMDDHVARKTALWALVDAAGDSMSFTEVERARRELADWPRAAKRQATAERLLETSGKSPRQIVDWFEGREPQTAQGAAALASAMRVLGQNDQAVNLVRSWWRNRVFEADAQRNILARFGDVLTMDDHARRADVLLYAAQGPAAREMIALLPADQQQAALARIALRSGASNALDQVSALPASVAQSPGVQFERAAFQRKKGLTELALAQAASFPKDITDPAAAEKLWDERYQLVLAALRKGDPRAAYAAADAGLTTGSDAAEAHFYAGWIALTRLKEPARAVGHFQAIDKIAVSPITKARAQYWLGRAAEASGDKASAQGFYSSAAKHVTTFYGQLAGEKLGQRLTLPADPQVTAADRNRFEGRDEVQAARLLYDVGQKNLFRSFVLGLDDMLPSAADQALLVDLARAYGDQDLSMKVARAAAQRGLILPDRAYPFRRPPQVSGAPEPALVLGITRQESGFDPLVRSHVGARGMMQLMPATAQIVARKMGVDYSPGMLDEPEYNMKLGSSFLGQLIGQFSGSYVMAVAGYNAGPGRPVQWSNFCGDPRGGSTDPIDFIECIPFSETRNYVMRVMEGMQVYRAKLNGGSAPITLSSDLQRGGYGYPALPTVAASAVERDS
jgi:soluble lytic murein transglycosylase